MQYLTKLSQQTEELHRLSTDNRRLQHKIQQLEREKQDIVTKVSRLQNENIELRSQ